MPISGSKRSPACRVPCDLATQVRRSSSTMDRRTRSPEACASRSSSGWRRSRCRRCSGNRVQRHHLRRRHIVALRSRLAHIAAALQTSQQSVAGAELNVQLRRGHSDGQALRGAGSGVLDGGQVRRKAFTPNDFSCLQGSGRSPRTIRALLREHRPFFRVQVHPSRPERPDGSNAFTPRSNPTPEDRGLNNMCPDF